jgi:hypothetical protein
MDQNTKDILDTVNFIKDRMLSKDEIREEFPGMIREELKPNSTPQALSRILRGLDARWKWSTLSHHSATRVAKLAPSAGRGDQERGETS